MNKWDTLVEIVYIVLVLILFVLKIHKARTYMQRCKPFKVFWCKSQIHFHIKIKSRLYYSLLKFEFLFVWMLHAVLTFSKLLWVQILWISQGFWWMAEFNSWYSAGQRYSWLDDSKLALVCPWKGFGHSLIIPKFIKY